MSLTLTMLIYASFIAILLVVIFLPRRGLLALWRASRLDVQRHRIEDALKYIFNRQQEDDPASVDALAGALNLNKHKAMTLASDLREQGLVQPNLRNLVLTPEGQRWALQVVRAHRLWERYLVDEARVPIEQVHNIAQKREHGMTTSQIDALDASLGHPALDPHGDPIPSPEGKLRKTGGHQPADLPLTQLEVGQSGQIFHMEDEPPVAYAQLVAAGLALGQVVTVLERTPQKISLAAGVNE
ncbi:MAG: hypothetical protein HPY76_09765, partial [Anaerolineae bacterium]|nr:hypothetical protein [Anaerolineae bacterium]